jgi:uncharacterized SAM-binding protein YcdF (DUF218 family)
LTISIAGILLLSMNVVAWFFSAPLEMWYDAEPFPAEPAEAIVILSGSVHPASANRPYTFAAQDTYERLQHGLWLFKHWNSLPILVRGGMLEEDEPYAATMRRVLESEGVPREMIWIENRSKSTHENAVYGSKILRNHGIARIALVVEANSMARAAAAFRKEGIAVVPAAIRFTKIDGKLTDVVPNWRAIALNGEALHEYLGIAWYRFRGWI